MKIAKFVLVATLAIFATQSQAAEYPISADLLDLRLLLENGAAIAKNMFKAVNDGLNQSKPHMDKILNEMAPEARNFIRTRIDEARKILKQEEERTNHVFSTLIKALDRLKPIKTCYDKISPNAKKLALSIEKQTVAVIQAVEKMYKEDIDNLKVGVQMAVKKARTLFDQEVEAFIGCLKPGRKDVGDCLQKEINKTLEGVQDILLDAFSLTGMANETSSILFKEIIVNLLPLLDKIETEGKVLVKTLSDCVSALKP